MQNSVKAQWFIAQLASFKSDPFRITMVAHIGLIIMGRVLNRWRLSFSICVNVDSLSKNKVTSSIHRLSRLPGKGIGILKRLQTQGLQGLSSTSNAWLCSETVWKSFQQKCGNCFYRFWQVWLHEQVWWCQIVNGWQKNGNGRFEYLELWWWSIGPHTPRLTGCVGYSRCGKITKFCHLREDQ